MHHPRCLSLLVLAATFFAADTAAAQDAAAQDQSVWLAPATIDTGSFGEFENADAVVLRDFALPGGVAVDLALERFEIFSPDARLVLGTDAGDVPLARPRLALLRGSVVGRADSHVFLSVTPMMINGVVELDGRLFLLSNGPYAAGLDAVVYEPARSPRGTFPGAGYECHIDELAPVVRSADEQPPVMLENGSGDACSRADVAIETDWQFNNQLFSGDASAAAAYAATLLAAMDDVYQRDFDTEIAISFLRIWDTRDDPWDAGNTSDQLNQFSNYWNANMRGVPRHLAHFLSGRGLGGGVAWLGVLCSPSLGYAVSANLGGSFPMPLQDNHPSNWDPYVVAHEMGHNFGAPHTHETTPPIDGCGNGDCTGASQGTIMSYCHLCSGGVGNIQLRFHPRTISESVMPYLHNTCVYRAGGPAFLTEPPATQTICTGESLVLSVTTDAADPLYQWRIGPVDLVDDGNIVGATTPTLQILSVGPEHAAPNYKCSVLDQATGCRRASQNAQVIVDEGRAVVLQQPQNQTADAGGFFRLDVRVDNAAAFGFRWRKDGAPLSDGGRIGGSTTPTLLVVAVEPTDAGLYDCEITSALGACGVVTDPGRVRIRGGSVCTADLNADGAVNLADLSVLLANFGTTSGAAFEQGDTDGDGDVDLADLSTLLSEFGTTCS